MSNGVFEQFATDDGHLALELLVQPAINFALVLNRVPLVRHLSLANRTDAPLPGGVADPRPARAGRPARRAVDPYPPRRPAAERLDQLGRLPGVRPGPRPAEPDRRGFPVDYRLTARTADRPDIRLTHCRSTGGTFAASLLRSTPPRAASRMAEATPRRPERPHAQTSAVRCWCPAARDATRRRQMRAGS
jgi:hypothetical protein